MTDLSKSSAQLLTRRNALPRILESIGRAQKTVHLVMYWIADDEVGAKVAAALSQAARRGVEVRVVYDAIGSWSTPSSFFAGLEASGVAVDSYHRVMSEVFHNWGFRRDHRKFLVVDGEFGFVGGMNLTEESMGPGPSEGLYDLGIFFNGAEASVLDELFHFSWKHSRLPFQLLKPRTPSTGEIEIVSNRFPRRRGIYRNLIHAMRSAQRSIDILNPYFLPPRRMLRALQRAMERGVRVRVLVPAWSDVRFVDLAMEGGFTRNLKLGIELYQWPGFIHAKTLIVDSAWSAVGSFNFDYLSLFSNLEVMAFVRDMDFNRSLAEEIERQFSLSRKLSLDELAKRSFVRKTLSRLFYSLRRWF